MNSHTALIAIDIQNDYFPGGRNPLSQPEKAAERARATIDLFRSHGLPVIHVQHVSTRPGSTFFLESDPHGCAIYPQVSPMPGEPVVIKHAPDSFLGTDLEEQLMNRGIEQLVICGMMTHMCVDTTVRSARGRGYDVTVISDACATKDLTWHDETVPAATVQASFMAALQGTFAKVIGSTELDELVAG